VGVQLGKKNSGLAAPGLVLANVSRLKNIILPLPRIQGFLFDWNTLCTIIPVCAPVDHCYFFPGE
jgi:hypothetical protein